MEDASPQSRKKLQVDGDWLGRVLVFLDDHRGSDARADRLAREASLAIEDTLVPIRWLDLSNPDHLEELRRDREQPD